jgi:hypothetical protein
MPICKKWSAMTVLVETDDKTSQVFDIMCD